MNEKDLIITPLYIILIYIGAYFYRSKIKNKSLKKYFIPALTLKIIGAISLGLIYQFYYGVGDTFNYFFHSTAIHDSFYENPLIGVEMIFKGSSKDFENLPIFDRLFWYYSPRDLLVSRIAALFSLFSFSTYSVIACFFAVTSFIGIWLMFITFTEIKKKSVTEAAIAILFIPSVFFWGSGIMKDSICLFTLGVMTYCIYKSVIKTQFDAFYFVIFLIAAYLTNSIKPYILIAFVPSAVLWWFWTKTNQLKNSKILKPFALILVISFSLIAMKINEDRLNEIALKAKTTADWVYYKSNIDGGSSYNIGKLDGTFIGMLKVFPAGVNVTLFRPYLFEVRNVVMVLSSLESTALLLITIFLFFKYNPFRFFSFYYNDPFLLFCLVFSIIFAFAIGSSTYNFGSLVRYKIPLLPFFTFSLLKILKRRNY